MIVYIRFYPGMSSSLLEFTSAWVYLCMSSTLLEFTPHEFTSAAAQERTS